VRNTRVTDKTMKQVNALKYTGRCPKGSQRNNGEIKILKYK